MIRQNQERKGSGMRKLFKDKKTEILVGLALEESIERDMHRLEYPDGEEAVEEPVFSEEHEKRMKQIFEIARKAEKRMARKKLYFRIAVGATVVLCLGTMTVFQMENDRKRFDKYG